MKPQIKLFIKKIIPAVIIKRYKSFEKKRYWLYKMPKKLSRRRSLLRFDIHLTDHCNLNCKGCEHFSSLADKTFLDISTFERDCARLSELTGGKVEDIAILGGEPLLHPKITEFVDIAKRYFRTGKIRILTNGMLLLKQTENFWQNCAKNNVEIHISQYPVKLDNDAINNMAKKYNIYLTWDYIDGIDWVRRPLDIEGKQKIEEVAKKCYQLNQCIQLVDGKLYTCARIAYIKYFNKRFNQNLQVTEHDYIDIYKASNLDEILDFLCKPVPFCRYCNINKTLFDIEWSVSKKNISEWIGGNP
jgi:MoaA/NifB/PqqE/SkfB family radical SAM enzyme